MNRKKGLMIMNLAIVNILVRRSRLSGEVRAT